MIIFPLYYFEPSADFLREVLIINLNLYSHKEFNLMPLDSYFNSINDLWISIDFIFRVKVVSFDRIDSGQKVLPYYALCHL